MSLKAKHWEECQVNGIAEPFILLSYALTYKQRIKHVHVLGINVFLCTVNVSDETCNSNSDFQASSECKHPVRESVRSLVTHVEGNGLGSPLISIIPVHHFRNVSYQKKKKKAFDKVSALSTRFFI